VTPLSTVPSLLVPGLHCEESHPLGHGWPGPHGPQDYAIWGLAKPEKDPRGNQEVNRRDSSALLRQVEPGRWVLHTKMVLEENLGFKLLNCPLGIIRGVTWSACRECLWCLWRNLILIKLWCFPSNVFHFHWLVYSFLTPMHLCRHQLPNTLSRNAPNKQHSLIYAITSLHLQLKHGIWWKEQNKWA
jgi:hypothetical protein